MERYNVTKIRDGKEEEDVRMEQGVGREWMTSEGKKEMIPFTFQ